MTERENIAAGAEARRAVSGKAWRSDEPLRQEMLLRYLGTVATVSAKQAAARRPTAPESAPSGRMKESAEPVSDAESAPLLVRDVMDVPAASVHGDMPFLDIARSLTRENVGSLPVVDDDDRVMGVVSVSDLLAKAAVEASGYEPGAIGRLRGNGGCTTRPGPRPPRR